MDNFLVFHRSIKHSNVIKKNFKKLSQQIGSHEPEDSRAELLFPATLCESVWCVHVHMCMEA